MTVRITMMDGSWYEQTGTTVRDLAAALHQLEDVQWLTINDDTVLLNWQHIVTIEEREDWIK